MIYKCAICDTVIYRPNRYFCWHCYHDFEDAIRGKNEWVKFVVSEETKRRRREKSERDTPITFIYLGDKWDIDLKGSLIRKEGYHYGQEKKRARSSRKN